MQSKFRVQLTVLYRSLFKCIIKLGGSEVYSLYFTACTRSQHPEHSHLLSASSVSDCICDSSRSLSSSFSDGTLKPLISTVGWSTETIGKFSSRDIFKKAPSFLLWYPQEGQYSTSDHRKNAQVSYQVNIVFGNLSVTSQQTCHHAAIQFRNIFFDICRTISKSVQE